MKKTWNFSWRNSFFPIVQTLIRNRIQSGFAWSGFAWMLKVSFPRGAASSAMVDVPRGRLPAGTHSVRLCLGIGGISALVFPRARTFDVRCLGYAVHDVLLPDIVAPPPLLVPPLRLFLPLPFFTLLATLSSLFLLACTRRKPVACGGSFPKNRHFRILDSIRGIDSMHVNRAISPSSLFRYLNDNNFSFRS